MANKIYLGLGSNKGDRKEHISHAIDLIAHNNKCRIEKISSLYETTPYGLSDQPNFYNAVMEISSELKIDELYEFLKNIEAEIGRSKNEIRWGPREIDVDILFYNNLIYNSDKLSVPHRDLLKRDFVIIPLLEIAVDIVHPVIDKKLSDLDFTEVEQHIIRKINFSTKYIIKLSDLRYIAIEGVIGAGKSSLAQKLSEKLSANLIMEEFEENPFLEKFYGDRKRFAFQTQMFFLINRYKQQQRLNQQELFSSYIVSDYIFEKDKIFAYLNLSGEELKLYENIFPLLEREIPKPDLVIFLQSSIDRLMQNIKSRGRGFEKNLTRTYLVELSEAYNNFFFKYNTTPLLIVNTTDIDFVNRNEDFDELYEQIFREDRGFIEYFNPEVKG